MNVTEDSVSIAHGKRFLELFARLPLTFSIPVDRGTLIGLVCHVEIGLDHPDVKRRGGSTSHACKVWVENVIALIDQHEPELALLMRWFCDPGKHAPDDALTEALCDAMDRINEQAILKEWFKQTFTPAIREPGNMLDAQNVYEAILATGKPRMIAMSHAVHHVVWAILNSEIAAKADEVPSDERAG